MSSEPAAPSAGFARREIPPSVSIALDLMRVLLALVVVACHLTQVYFQEGWPDRTKLAIVAVGGFFVLSGYTISLLTQGAGPFDLRRFAAERLSRLWSVAVPALVLTLVCDGLAHVLAPDYYASNWGHLTTMPVVRLTANLLFIAQLWGLDLSPLSNSPFWSLSYELGFYALYAAWMASRRAWRYAAVALLLAVLGPNIAFMSLFWLAGVTINVLHERLSRRATFVVTVSASVFLVAATTVLWLDRALMAHAATWMLGAIDRYFGWFGIAQARVTRTLLMGGLVFTVLFFCLVGFARANDRVDLRRWVPGARRLGELTFPLYLFHFPLLVVCGAVGFYDRHSAAQKTLVLTLIIAAIVALTPLTVRLKFWLRRLLERMLRPGAHTRA